MFCLFAEEEKTTKHGLVFLFVKQLHYQPLRFDETIKPNSAQQTNAFFSLTLALNALGVPFSVCSVHLMDLMMVQMKSNKNKQFEETFESIDTNMSSIRGGLSVAKQKPNKESCIFGDFVPNHGNTQCHPCHP